MTDVNYYFLGAGAADGLREYPHAATWVIHALYGLTGDNLSLFQLAFMGMNLLIDALLLALLLRGGVSARHPGRAGWFWVFFGTACGQVLLMRLDLIPAALVGAFAALLFINGALAATALAAATAVKLWPGVLGAGLVGRAGVRSTWVRVGVFFLALVGFLLLTWATGGAERIFSPVTYQEERGLQVESVAATPALVAAQFHPERYQVHFAESKSWEISGPGVEALITVADTALLLVVAGALGWALVSLRRGRFRPEVTVALGVTLIAGLLVSNKVFSPQYVIWLGPILAVALRTSTLRHPHVLGVLVILSALLSTVVYPFTYGEVLAPGSGWTGVGALVLRNLCVLVILGYGLLWLRTEIRTPTPARPAVSVR